MSCNSKSSWNSKGYKLERIAIVKQQEQDSQYKLQERHPRWTCMHQPIKACQMIIKIYTLDETQTCAELSLVSILSTRLTYGKWFFFLVLT